MPREVGGPADDHRQASGVLRQQVHRAARHRDQQGPDVRPDQHGIAGATAKAEAAAATAPNAPATKALQAQAAALQGQTTALFQGETLRGLLLTSYGFSIFGERAGQAAWVAFLVAAVLFLASIAGFVHAFTTSKDEVVLNGSSDS